jgi:hypothetical protein
VGRPGEAVAAAGGEAPRDAEGAGDAVDVCPEPLEAPLPQAQVASAASTVKASSWCFITDAAANSGPDGETAH